MRNRYEPAGGVVPIRWKPGAPSSDSFGLFLVEVWTPEVNYWGQFPSVRVRALVEVWIRRGDGMFRIDAGGQHHEVTTERQNRARRWARANGSRWWDANVTLDKWGTP